jgi:CheY-like chemotaxis protein
MTKLIWPLVFLIVVLTVLFMSRGHFAPKDIELSAKGLKVSFYLVQAEERGGPGGQASKLPIDEKMIIRAAGAAQSISLVGKRILWVDDNPENNINERQALEALGLTFTLAENTTQALEKLNRESFDAVISDFKRKDDYQGGYTLLAALKERNLKIPYLIYSSSASSELEAEAKRRGALGETNRPTRLFELVIEALQKRP